MALTDHFDSQARLDAQYDPEEGLVLLYDPETGAPDGGVTCAVPDQAAVDSIVAARRAQRQTLKVIDNALVRGAQIRTRAATLEAQATTLSQKTTVWTVAEQKAVASALAELFGAFSEMTQATMYLIREVRHNHVDGA